MGNVKKLPVNGFTWVEEIAQFNEDFINIYNENSDIGYFIGVDVQYPEKLYELYNDLFFLLEKLKLESIEELVSNLHDKEEYFIYKRNLKQSSTHGLVLKKCIEPLNLIKKLG